MTQCLTRENVKGQIEVRPIFLNNEEVESRAVEKVDFRPSRVR